MDAVYNPNIFVTETPQQAAQIILTPENGLTTRDRWLRETPWLIDRIVFAKDACVIDWGCGIGRLAKDLPCSVVGVDISPTMRAMAIQYVNRNDFAVMSAGMFSRLSVTGGARFEGAMAVWVLQHCKDPEVDISLIWTALRPGAPFYVLNRNERILPTDVGWVNDGLDIHRLVCERFDLAEEIPLDPAIFAHGATLRKYLARAD